MTPGRKCSCKNGRIIAYACPGFRQVIRECSRCEGSGWIDPERDEALAAGKKFRSKRNSLDLSIRESARLLSMNVADLSGLEFARNGATAKQIPDLMARLVQRHKERGRPK